MEKIIVVNNNKYFIEKNPFITVYRIVSACRVFWAQFVKTRFTRLFQIVIYFL